jgi:hypothetical protein
VPQAKSPGQSELAELSLQMVVAITRDMIILQSLRFNTHGSGSSNVIRLALRLAVYHSQDLGRPQYSKHGTHEYFISISRKIPTN